MIRSEIGRISGFAIVILTILVLSSFTLPKNADSVVTQLNINHGLSNNDVTCFYQDHQGFMWIGTYDGLNRFDGSSFIIYKNVFDDSTSLVNNRVSSILEDGLHNLWVGTFRGVSRYNRLTSKFQAIRINTTSQKSLPIVGNVSSIMEGSDKNIFLASDKEGLLIFDYQKQYARSVTLLMNGKSIYGYDASSLAMDSKGSLFVLVRNVGLCLLDRSINSLVVVNDKIKDGTCLKIHKSMLWIGTDDGLFYYEPLQKTVTQKLTNVKIVQLSTDRKESLWIATDGNGILILDNAASSIQEMINTGKDFTMNNRVVYAVYEDREKRRWIGSLRGGVTIINQKSKLFHSFTHDRPNESVNNNLILSFYEDADHSLWVGTDGGGIRKWDYPMKDYVIFKNDRANQYSLSSDFVTNIKADGNGDIWISTWGGGINKFHKSSNRFIQYPCYNPISKVNDRFGWVLFNDSKGTLWATTCNNGSLYRFNSKADRFEIFDTSLTNIISLAEDTNGNLWGGNFSYLIKIDREAKHHEFHFIGNPVRAIHEDSVRNLWVGTENGGLLLVNRKTKLFQRYTDKDGLPSNSVLNILEDDNGNLWMSTYHGLSRLNIASMNFKNFSSSDGLLSNQFNYNAAIKLKSGELVFGGISGFNLFSPIDGKFNQHKGSSNVHLSDIKVNNSSIHDNLAWITKAEAGRILEITIPYGNTNISIGYIAPEFEAPDKIKYAFRLKGMESNWNLSNKERAADYSKLPPGTFNFEVKTSNEDGTWNEEQNLLVIVVLPPWYKTGWAYTLYACFLVVLILVLNKLKSYRKANESRINQVIQQQDINENRLSFFTYFSHELRNQLTLILNPIHELLAKQDNPEDRSDLKIVYKNAKRLLELTNRMLLLRKSDSDLDVVNISFVNLFSLCTEVYDCFYQTAKSKGIDYKFVFTNKSLTVPVDREKIEIVLFNLLSNAFKFTPANGVIEFKVHEMDGCIKIEISDSGSGISKDIESSLFKLFCSDNTRSAGITGFGIGLFLAHKFVTQHNGTITYGSNVNQGTVFTVLLPQNQVVEADVSTACQQQTTNSFLDNFNFDIDFDLELDEKIPDNQNKPADVSNLNTVLVIDNNADIRAYLTKVFKERMIVYEAADGETGFFAAQKYMPDVILCDISMPGMSGLELCQKIKMDSELNHIPVVIVTGILTDEMKLAAIKNGAEDYITKPFDQQLLLAKLDTLLKSRSQLQEYFFDTITLQKNSFKVPSDFKIFLDTCIATVENNLENDDFNVQKMAKEIGMSHSNLYKKVKLISGLSVTHFIRSIRIRKAAVLMLKSNLNVSEASLRVGFSDVKYFRTHFYNLFGLKPAEYIKKYKHAFNSSTIIK